MNDNYDTNDQNDRTIRIYGKVVCEGTKENPITFTSVGGEEGERWHEYWHGIEIINGQFDAEYVQIEHAGTGIDVKEGYLELKNSVISECHYCGIRFDTNIQPVVLYNCFKNNERAT